MNFLQRLAARIFFGTHSVFEGANQSPRRSNVPGSGPRDTTLDLTPGVRSELVRRSRYLVKNSGFLQEIISSMALYAIGDGILPQPSGKDARWNQQALAYFNRWAHRAEITGRFDLTTCLYLACMALETDGEIFVLKTEEDGEPKIQLIETHRIGSSGAGEESDGTTFATATAEDSLIDGIRLSPLGRPLGYRLLLDDGSHRELAARDVLHVFAPMSISQVRGYPTIQHSINHMLDILELLALEKHAVKDNADIARVLKTSRYEVDDRDFQLSSPPQPSGSDPGFLQTILGGKLVKIQPDEAIESFQSNRPSPTFQGFLDYLQRDSALGLLPYEFASDSSKIGGAGVRLIVAKADRRFSRRQTLLIDRMLRPIWRFVIGHAITAGKLPPAEDWTEVDFVTPRRVTVDAGRESQQNREDVKAGLKTLSDHFAELGCDINHELETRAREMALIRDIAARYQLNPQDLCQYYIPSTAP